MSEEENVKEFEWEKCSCCDRAGEYNGFASDGPLLFVCPSSCECHD